MLNATFLGFLKHCAGDHPVVILHQQYYPNAVFNALSRVTLAAAAAVVPGVNDDLHHFTAHEP